MNRISINLKQGESIGFTDPEDITKDQAEEKLASLFSINNIAILKTDNISIILRPSDISSIRIEEVMDIIPVPQKIENPLPKVEPKEAIDIITDID
jgi:hypothetical protein